MMVVETRDGWRASVDSLRNDFGEIVRVLEFSLGDRFEQIFSVDLEGSKARSFYFAPARERGDLLQTADAGETRARRAGWVRGALLFLAVGVPLQAVGIWLFSPPRWSSVPWQFMETASLGVGTAITACAPFFLLLALRNRPIQVFANGYLDHLLTSKKTVFIRFEAITGIYHGNGLFTGPHVSFTLRGGFAMNPLPEGAETTGLILSYVEPRVGKGVVLIEKRLRKRAQWRDTPGGRSG